MAFLFSPRVGMMIQSDALIFFRGVGQPPTSPSTAGSSRHHGGALCLGLLCHDYTVYHDYTMTFWRKSPFYSWILMANQSKPCFLKHIGHPLNQDSTLLNLHITSIKSHETALTDVIGLQAWTIRHGQGLGMWLRNPSRSHRMGENLSIMGMRCLPPINWCKILQPCTVPP